MYVFSESALQLALGADAKLWREAYDKGVIIAGSQSLFIMLRVLEMSWKQMRQFENQQDIMRQANLLIDRVQLFYERFLKVDEQLHRTQEAFDELRRSTAPNGLSITTAATRLLKYGAQENPKRRRHLPKAEDDVEEEDSQE
jgi:DNA recombination protein RmuC